MLTVAPPDLEEARSNATFEALMWSMARPGEQRELAEPGLAPIIEAFLDLECTAYADDAELAGLIARTGAERVEALADADHVFLAQLDGLAELEALNCGSALYPDDGATLVVTAAIGQGQRLRLSGPGIEGTREIALGLPAAFWALRQKLCAYPQGFELFVVDGRAVIGIPRSTQVEVL